MTSLAIRAFIVAGAIAVAGCAANPTPAAVNHAPAGASIAAAASSETSVALRKKKAKKRAAPVDTTKYAVAVCNLLTGMTEEQIVRKAVANGWPIKGSMAEFVHTAHMTLCPKVR